MLHFFIFYFFSKNNIFVKGYNKRIFWKRYQDSSILAMESSKMEEIFEHLKLSQLAIMVPS